jgi:hypothetical protein
MENDMGALLQICYGAFRSFMRDPLPTMNGKMITVLILGK